MEDNTNLTDEDKLLQKQRNEKKELQAEIQKLKHAVPKGDKKRRKEILEQVTSMEAELTQRHEQELERFNAINGQEVELSERVNELSTDDAKGAIGASACDDETVEVACDKPSKLSKAQKRRNKKAAQERDRQAAIDDQDIENLTGPRHLETQKIKQKLSAQNLVVSEIPSDGNCLYAAVVDQLKQQGATKSLPELRQVTASYMRDHMEDFLPFLCKQDTGDMYTPEEYEVYCLELESTPAWGGQLEIQALSEVLKCPIEVIQAEAPPITSGEQHSSQKLILTYHRHVYGLGAHYNSVKPKPANEEEEFS